MSVKLTDRASVPAVVAEMTTEEKIRLVSGGCTFSTAAIDRLGIPAALMTDAGVGVNLRQYMTEAIRRQLIDCVPANWGKLSTYAFIMDHVEDRNALNAEENKVLDAFLDYLKENFLPGGEMPSCFPVNSLLASSWDENLLYETARCVGREASAYGVDILLGSPGINVQRDPRGGRGFEYYSEDPCLISRLAPMYAKGVQEQGVIADVKHFAANSQETNRHTIDEHISLRALREIYLPGFEACVKEGGVKTVMSSYNKINGVYASQWGWLQEDVLRDEWGFDGFVMSDWGGVKNHPESIKNGGDLRMPPPKEDELAAALADGRLDEATLDKAVCRILNVLVEMPVMKGRKFRSIDEEAGRKTAYRAAAESIVLLKNSGALPLSEGTAVAFYGDGCRQFVEAGIGSGRVHTTKHSSLSGRTECIVGSENVTYNAVTAKTGAVIVTVSALGQEGADRDDISLPAEEMALVKKAICDAKTVGAKVILILNVAGPIEVEEVYDDLDAMVLTYFPGMEGGNACADILFGRKNPCGKLAQTFPKHLYDVPAFGNFPGEYDSVNYGEGIFVGYRHYDLRHIEPRFCFGHGLSYTTFELSGAKLGCDKFNHNTDGGITVSVTVKNTGKMAGAEVVQLYLADVKSTMPKPVKELKNFRKVFLQPGEEKEITFQLTRKDFCSYDEKKGWVVEPGLFKVLLGVSSRDIRCTLDLPVVGKNPYGYGAETKFKTLLMDDRAMDVLKKTLPEGVWTDNHIAQEKSYPASKLFAIKFRQEIAPRIPNLTEEEKESLLEKVCDRLSDIDVTDMTEKYKETEIY